MFFVLVKHRQLAPESTGKVSSTCQLSRNVTQVDEAWLELMSFQIYLFCTSSW